MPREARGHSRLWPLSPASCRGCRAGPRTEWPPAGTSGSGTPPAPSAWPPAPSCQPGSARGCLKPDTAQSLGEALGGAAPGSPEVGKAKGQSPEHQLPAVPSKPQWSSPDFVPGKSSEGVFTMETLFPLNANDLSHQLSDIYGTYS